jgi:hypothetical protein
VPRLARLETVYRLEVEVVLKDPRPDHTHRIHQAFTIKVIKQVRDNMEKSLDAVKKQKQELEYDVTEFKRLSDRSWMMRGSLLFTSAYGVYRV